MSFQSWFSRISTIPSTIFLALLAALLPLASCGLGQSDDSGNSHVDTSAKNIVWFDGTIDEAFTLAKSEGKPLFLYWGAEWCPPCHYLKNRIFIRPEFIARMRDFVPVYLDGDSERAQILGEELEVMGYPTVIIFNPLGQEVTRMPSTVPANQYENFLDAAVASLQPVKTVLEEVLAGGAAAATPGDLNLLAYYSWGQDSHVGLPIEEQVDAFRTLLNDTPAGLEVEKSRFLGLYLQSLIRMSWQDDSTAELGNDERRKLQAQVIDVLKSSELRNANLVWIEYYAESIIDFLQPDDTPERHELLAAWQAAADELELDDTLSVDDRLTATILKIHLAIQATGDDGDEVEISGELQAHARRQAAWAIDEVTDESELQTVVNTLAYLLETADLNDEAEAMLLAKMNDTAAPYYFMSWIGGLKEDAGETELAVEWYRRAYDAAQGRYTRFRWGSTYLRRLMDLSPESAERIESDSVEVLSELLTHEDAFAGGNHSRLEGLETAYWTWNGDNVHEAELSRIRDFVHGACQRYPDEGEDSQRGRCESFLLAQEVEGDAAI